MLDSKWLLRGLGLLFAVSAVAGAESTETETAVDASAETQESGRKSADDRELPREALVLISSVEGGQGSGFIATMQGRTFLVSNAHVLGMGEN